MFRLLLIFGFAALAVAFAAPVSAAASKPEKSLFASISANDESGAALMSLILAGKCEFTPVPVCTVVLKDTAFDTPILTGAATGTARIELAPNELVLREVDLRMDKATLRLDEKKEQTVSLRLKGNGEYTPATSQLNLSKVTMTTDQGVVLSGKLLHSPDSFKASLGVNVKQPAKLARLLGLSKEARKSLPTGPVVLDLTASGDGSSFGPLGINLLTTAQLRNAVTLGGPDTDGFILPAMKLKARIRTDQPDTPLLASIFLPGGTVHARGDVESGKYSLRAKGLDLGELAPFLTEISGQPIAEWTPAGRLDLSSDATLTDSGINADTRLKVREVVYMSPLADYMGQGVNADLRLKTRLNFAKGSRMVNAKLSVPSGELLFGPTYLNMTNQPLELACNAEQTAPLRFRNLKADVAWGTYGKLSASGDLVAEGPVEKWKYKADLEAVELNLGRWFDTLADAKGLTDFKGEHGLEGEGALDLHLVSDGIVADATGLLYIADGTLTSADGSVEVRGASVYLPLSYRMVGPYLKLSPQFVAADGWGEMHADLVRAPYVEMKNSTTRMALIPNRLFIADPLVLSVLGGEVRLASIQVDQPFSKRFQLRLGANMEGLDLAQSTKGKFPLEGMLSGNLGTITLDRNALYVPGSIQGTFFGGSLLIDRIFAENPMDKHRKLGLSVTVREMDLERISTAMDVGRVTGNMDLDIHDFVVAYGEPVGMLLRAETSGEGDFDKTVSLKAVNSLSVIGTGSGLGDMGVGMFAQFFEEFSYQRIGFQCTLNNDIFRVRGLVRDGGVEYLIKKPWLTGINVVNSNPNNYISFKDMLERVQRVVGDKEKTN